MAKHMVKCPYCSERFDTNAEPFFKVGERRYAHAKCYEQHFEKLSAQEQQQKDLENYIKEVFSMSSVPAKIQEQIKSFKKKYLYSDKGILDTLRYEYTLKKRKPSLEEGVYFVPRCYDEANNYYYQIWRTNQRNLNEEIFPLPQDNVIHTVPQKRKIRKSKEFSFLDEE